MKDFRNMTVKITYSATPLLWLMMWSKYQVSTRNKTMSHIRTFMDFMGLGIVNSRPSASLPSMSRLKSAQVTF